ncbi:MAG TPA: ornithine cyclodeaminase family protein [Ktedonobacterales bacterium]|jgi:ornithine cyclodeaminase/alanine dehydrogenase-like protein (mu-crystallin family)|nr:ornithine cyclodeaminase family protein [Ktedonobacterales bacterium]
MALALREEDVRALLTMPETMRVLEGVFRRQGAGEVRNQPRMRIALPEGRGVMHTLPAYVPGQAGDPAAEGPGFVGLKSYVAVAGKARFVVLLSSAEDGRLLAIIEADLLGQMRTGAASGVATRYMARDDARVVALLGAGGQARTQALAMVTARPVRTMLVYARDQQRRESFCEEMAQATGVEMRPVASAEEAVRAADIVVTATTAKDPVMHGEWLRPGAHVNAMGSNWGHRREVDTETVLRSALIAVDDEQQAKIEAGDLLIPEHEGRFSLVEAAGEGRLVELGQIVAGKVAGRPDAEAITLFKSLGIGAEDVATAAYIYQQARERGIGQEFPFVP